MQNRALIFDIDGTLIDPLVGITRSIVYALDSLGLESPGVAELREYIGPPLRQTFAKLIGPKDERMIDDAMQLYRERFATHGIQECTLYPGMPELLRDLAATTPLFVATARIQRLTDMILEHFSIAEFFTAAYGTDPFGAFEDKAELLAHLCNEQGLDPAACVMIGDRDLDISAAKKNNSYSIGVTYGFGSREELEIADADRIVASINELRRLLLGPYVR